MADASNPLAPSLLLDDKKWSPYNPYDLAVGFVFYSPLLVVFSIFVLTWANQSPLKGGAYLVWLVLFAGFRALMFALSGAKKNAYQPDADRQCSQVDYGAYGYGSPTLSMFIIAFTFVYVCGPMIINSQINFFVLIGFLFLLLLDIYIRCRFKCTSYLNAGIDVGAGTIAGTVALVGMYGLKAYNYIFFNETSSDKDMCSMPSKQSFRCKKVYKNGQLIGDTGNPLP
jgi:hypothetical protein